MPPYHVLHLLSTSEVEGTGVARIVAALAERLDPKEFKFHAWFGRGHGPLVEMLEKKGVEVRVLDWAGGVRNPVGLWRFTQGIRKHKFDIVHQHDGGRAIRLISRYVGGARVITHLHCLVLEQDWEVPAQCNVYGADVVVATSDAVAKWAGVDAEVVYPGVDICKAHPAMTCGGHTLGIAGRLVQLKGTLHLIRALPMVRAEVPDVMLEIAGSGPEEEVLRREAHSLGLDGRVRFLGWQEEIPFNRWDVFVMPSLEEAFGMAALEAMAAGLPVVASAVGGLTELVQDGKTGWLFPPADIKALAGRLVSLLLSPEERFTMGAAARDRANMFSTKRMSERIELLYRRLL
ncbi:MAG: glycosyltransferase family 4 protein [Nitrospirota bacterium]